MLEAFIGIAAAILGFSFREFINRLRPFFQLVEIDGGTRKLSDRPSIPPELRTALSRSVVVKPLAASPNIEEIYDKAEEARRILESSPNLEELAHEVLLAESEADWYDALARLTAKRRFASWMLRLLVNDTVRIEGRFRRRKPRVEFVDDDESDGCVWFLFPLRSVKFGRKLKSPAIRAKAMPWIRAISLGERDLVNDALLTYLATFQLEREIAEETLDELDAMVNRNSRWVFVVYLANMNDVPFAVTDDPVVTVIAPGGRRFKIPCRLAYPSDSETERFIPRLRDLHHPLIVKPAADEKFGLVTRGRQRDIPDGDAIRSLYESGEGKIRVELNVRTVGVRPNQRLKTPLAPFVGS